MAKIRVKVRIVHTGKEVTMGLDDSAQGKQIVKALFNNADLNLVQTNTDGNPIEYKLSSKAKGVTIGSKTLKEAGVTEGDILLLHQELIAG